MLALSNLTASIDKKTILHKIKTTFAENRIYAIMGPNGSGKSTLVQTIIGNPLYSVSPGSKISFNTIDITNLTSDKRALLGIGTTFQSPIALQGVSVFQLLRLAKKDVDVLDLYKQIEKIAKKLKINKELIDRPLNEGASGGERKKLEVLQMAILNPSIIFFDEIDTGVDVDSLKTIFTFLKEFKKDKTFVFITHYSKIFSYLEPESVLIMKEGKIVKEGGGEVVDIVEKKGYEAF
ncbi:MAG: Fe-S cluster assembly ATPase SufC [Microgenomates group bacterium]